MSQNLHRMAVACYVLFILSAAACGQRHPQQADHGNITAASPAAASTRVPVGVEATYTLKLNFYGLVAFVPIDANADLTTASQVWAILPRADYPDQKNVPNGAHPGNRRIPIHQPFLRVPLKYLQDSRLFPDTPPVLLSLGSANATSPTSDMSDYHGHDITFNRPFIGDQVKLTGFKEYVPNLADPDAPNNKAKYICPTCLDQKKPPVDVVGARVLITAGELRADCRVKLPIVFGFYNSMYFSSKDKKYDDLAQCVKARITIPAAPLTLVLNSYTTGQDPQYFILTPPTAGTEIELDIVNLPGDELVNRMEAIRTNDNVSDHFGLYYLVSAKIKDSSPILLPQALHHGGQPYCGVAHFLP
jgi:hypothetical protein